jgi:hypothetical protein
MKRYNYKIILAVVLALLGPARQALAQAVAVTAQLDATVISVGQSTTLHIYAQVIPAYRTNSDRIFSWYLDVLSTNGTAAGANYSALLKTASDNDPLISSNGFTSGANRLGVYDTFLNRPGAGVSNRVELMSIPVSGLSAGQTRFTVRPGTGITNLSEDFLVAPKSGGNAVTGGDYNAAFANLTVLAPASNSITCLTISRANLAGGLNKVTVQFCPLAGYDHYVEYRDQLLAGPGWQSFPNGPHNSGLYVDTNNVPTRFYRIRANPTGGLAAFQVTITYVNATQLRLTYPVAAGFNYTVESRTNLVTGSWQPLPGGPHNSGNVSVTNAAAREFFRVGARPQ